MKIDAIMDAASVIPVLEVAAIEAAAPLAEALASGGLRVVELTMRTDCALEAVGVMKEAAPSLIVGMGTVRTPDDVRQSLEAGAEFLVSPGAGPVLLEAMAASDAPSLPGVATASEAMTVYDAGLKAMKFFPAEPAGGIAYLKSLYGPLPDIVFCPTGGISAERAPDYLALPNVACVGGSWIATKKLIADGDWDAIAANAKRAASLKP
jgi:2-dehydro-3-deoxyphosphogluconate aldolase/(4S)-4-hydroxy-2-oxoglutarate aldolase